MSNDLNTGRFTKKYSSAANKPLGPNSPKKNPKLLTTGSKISAPKPLNLPSLRHEHGLYHSPDSAASTSSSTTSTSPSGGNASNNTNTSNTATASGTSANAAINRWGSPALLSSFKQSDAKESTASHTSKQSPSSSSSSTSLPSSTQPDIDTAAITIGTTTTTTTTAAATTTVSATTASTATTKATETKKTTTQETKTITPPPPQHIHRKSAEIPMPFTQASEPSTMSWDEMVSEEMDFTVSVVEFADGTKVAIDERSDIEEEEEEEAEEASVEHPSSSTMDQTQQVSPSDRFTDDYDRTYPPKRRPSDQPSYRHMHPPPPPPSSSSAAAAGTGYRHHHYQNYHQHHHPQDQRYTSTTHETNERYGYRKYGERRESIGTSTFSERRASTSSWDQAKSVPVRRHLQEQPQQQPQQQQHHLYTASDDRPPEIVAAQREAMLTAAEQAKKRREADEAERQAAAERARQKALALAPKKEEKVASPPPSPQSPSVTKTKESLEEVEEGLPKEENTLKDMTGAKEENQQGSDDKNVNTLPIEATQEYAKVTQSKEYQHWHSRVKDVTPKVPTILKKPDSVITTTTTSAATASTSTFPPTPQREMTEDDKSWEQYVKNIKNPSAAAEPTTTTMPTTPNDWSSFAQRLQQTNEQKRSKVISPTTATDVAHLDKQQIIPSPSSPRRRSDENEHVNESETQPPEQGLVTEEQSLDKNNATVIKPNRRFVNPNSRLRQAHAPIFPEFIERLVASKPASLHFMLDPDESDDELIRQSDHHHHYHDVEQKDTKRDILASHDTMPINIEPTITTASAGVPDMNGHDTTISTRTTATSMLNGHLKATDKKVRKKEAWGAAPNHALYPDGVPIPQDLTPYASSVSPIVSATPSPSVAGTTPTSISPKTCYDQELVPNNPHYPLLMYPLRFKYPPMEGSLPSQPMGLYLLPPSEMPSEQIAPNDSVDMILDLHPHPHPHHQQESKSHRNYPHHPRHHRHERYHYSNGKPGWSNHHDQRQQEQQQPYKSRQSRYRDNNKSSLNSNSPGNWREHQSLSPARKGGQRYQSKRV